MEAIERLFKEGNFTFAETEVLSLLNTELSDIERGYVLFKYARILRALGKYESEKAQIVDGQIIEIANNTGDLRLLALAKFRIGDRHFCAGRLREAKTAWENSLNLFIETKDSSSYEFAYIHFHLGILHRDLFGFPVAISYLTKALELARRSEMSYLIRQCLTELFFCHFYQDEFKLCQLSFEQIQKYSRGHLTDIENLILRSYLNMGQKKYRHARRQLIEAYVLVRKHGLSKNRYDMYFHFAYLYSLVGNFKKAWQFMTGSEDPVYRLMLHELEARTSKNIEMIKKYQELANACGIVAHQEMAHQLLGDVTKTYVRMDVSFDKCFAAIRNKKISFKGRSLISEGLKLALSRKQFTKRDVLESIFKFSHYDSVIHDSKVYKFISEVNQFFGFPIFVAKNEEYHLNPLLHLSNLDNKTVSSSVLIREIFVGLGLLQQEITGKILRGIFGPQTRFVQMEIEKTKRSE